MKILALLFLFVSCSHQITIKNPANRFLSAEAQGKPLKGQVHFFMSEGTEAQVDLRNSRTDNALVLDREKDRLLDIIINGEIGIWGPVDFIHISGGRRGADLSGAKVQLYGADKQSADRYNFSVALMGGYGAVTNNLTEGEDLELVPLNDDTTTELQISNQALGLLISYRTSEKFVVNLGYHSLYHNFFGRLDSQNTTLDGQSINYKGHSAITTLGFFSYSGNFIFAVEFASERLKWDKTDESHNVYSNIALGVNW